MFFLLSAALAAEIPERFHGDYYPLSLVDSWFTDEPEPYASGPHVVSGERVWVDQGQDGTGWAVAGALSGGRFRVTEDYLNDPSSTEIGFVEAPGRPTVLTFGGTKLVRLTEVFSMMELESSVLPSQLATQALLSLGWYTPSAPFVFLPSPQGKHHLLDTSEAFGGGFGLGGDIFTYKGKELGFTVGGGSMTLTETVEDATGYTDVVGGMTLALTRMDEPPFVILADRLNLRSGPSRTKPARAVVQGGAAVQVWGAAGDWLLLSAGRELGWGHRDYVGRRTSPLAGRPEVGSYTLESALTGDFPFDVQSGPGASGCVSGTAKTPTLPTSTAATARVTNLDGEAPLDLICLISATDAGKATVVACPITRSGTTSTTTACGVLDALPLVVGSKEVQGGRALVLGETVYTPSDAGWMNGVLPKAGSSEPPGE